MRALRHVLCIIAALPTAAALAGDLRIVPQESILAIVTHKAGIAAGLAHNHLVAASGYEADLSFDPEAPLDTRFTFRAKAAELVIDAPELQRRWNARLEELGILDEAFKEVPEKDRRKVREAMLGSKQLEVERFPDISGSIVEVAKAEGDADFPYRVKIDFEAHGQHARRELRSRVERTDRGFVLEAVGDFRFTDFGIEPYSAFLGAVKNRDEIQLFVSLQAVPASE